MSMQKKYQGGFTLVEIAIVLVIIGLLLGGVLKGQELIYNQKVKSTYDSYRQYTAAMYGYQDRYRAIPGDDANALTRGFIVGAGPAAQRTQGGAVASYDQPVLGHLREGVQDQGGALIRLDQAAHEQEVALRWAPGRAK